MPISNAAHPAPGPSAAASPYVVFPSTPGERKLILAIFFTTIFLTIAATSWKIAGIPLHSVFTGVLLVVLSASHRPQASRAVRRHAHLLNLTVLVALLGILVSILNGADAASILNEVVEIHIQTIVLLLLGGVVSEICGARSVLLCVLGAIVLSASFAVFQFAGFDFPWAIREKIITIAGKDPARRSAIRPPGLSFSKIALGTQMCLAFAAFYIYRARTNALNGRQDVLDLRIFIWVIVFAVMCMASGNRSPIVGGVVFYAFYFMRRRPYVALAAAFVGLLCLPVLDDVIRALSATGLRAFSFGDKSSEGRETLLYYGFRLFQQNPLGYGLGFDPRMYWSDHWAFVQSMPNAVAVREEELHSYIMNMLDYYGITILLLIPYAVYMIRRRSWALIGFIPYMIHITFHNYGPFQNDTLIMYIIASVVGPFYPEKPNPILIHANTGWTWQKPWYIRTVRHKPLTTAT